MTAKKLKKLLNLSIKMWLSKTGKSKIPLSKFKSAILTQYDSTILSQYSITLYKNGKTVKISKFNIKDNPETIDMLKPWTSSFTAAKKKTPMISKEMKKIILAGKMEALASFHMMRNHTKEFPTCLACKAVKAFLEWEFHYSPPPKDKVLNVPKIGTFTAEELTEKVKFIQMDKVVVEEIEETIEEENDEHLW